jgi:hypothetical protein
MDVLMGKSSINGPFSMAMLKNQRVHQNQFNAQLLVSNIIQTPQ